MASLQRRTWRPDFLVDTSNPAAGSMGSEVTAVSVVLLFQTRRLNPMMRKHQQNLKWDPGSEVPAPTASQGLRAGLLRLK